MHTETHTAEHAHPGYGTYIKIALILTIITAIEVAVYYIDDLRPYLVPVLLSLSVVKFYMVVAYFMHLKFDPKLLTGLFVFGLTLAAVIVLSLQALLGYAGNTVTEGTELAPSAQAAGGH